MSGSAPKSVLRTEHGGKKQSGIERGMLNGWTRKPPTANSAIHLSGIFPGLSEQVF